MKQHKHTESTHYDKLWVHTNQRFNDFRKNKMDTKARDHEYDKLDTFIQPQKSYTTRQQTEHINLEYENSTFVNKPGGKIVPSQTEVDIETVQLAEQVGNGEGLYDVTGLVSVEKVTAEEESNCDNYIGVQPITPDCELGECPKDRAMEKEAEDEDESSTIKVPQIAEGEELYDTAVNCGRMKKPKNVENVEEIYDVVVSQLATRNNNQDRMVPRVAAYAVCTVPMPTVPPRVDAYAVCTLPAI